MVKIAKKCQVVVGICCIEVLGKVRLFKAGRKHMVNFVGFYIIPAFFYHDGIPILITDFHSMLYLFYGYNVLSLLYK